MNNMSDKLWGGRFTAKAAEWVDEFGASIHFDQKMAAEDIEGSIAHAKMLGKQGIISPEESAKIVAGLKIINEELIAGKIEFDVKRRYSYEYRIIIDRENRSGGRKIAYCSFP